VAINPVELISLARKRIARIAAIRASIYFLAPALTAIVLGAMLPAIGAMTWERMGYLLAPDVMFDARGAMAAAASSRFSSAPGADGAPTPPRMTSSLRQSRLMSVSIRMNRW